MQCQCADTHKHAALAVHPQGLLDALGHCLQILGTGVLVHLVDERHVLLAHADDEVILPVREQPLDHVHRHRLQPLIHRADHKHAARRLRGHVQLLGAHIDVADEDIIRNNVLDEGALVVLLLVIALGRVQRHGGHGAHGAAHAVVAAGKDRVVEVGAPAGQCLEGAALQRNAGTLRRGNGLHILAPLLADTRQLAAGDHRTVRVNDADGAIRRLLELQYHILKNSSRHNDFLLRTTHRYFVQSVKLMLLLYRHYDGFASIFFFFSQKICLIFC